MHLTDIFIRRPVVAVVVNLVILIAGLQAIATLNLRQYPRTESAAVTITTAYPGASPQLVRGFITTPLERAVAAADGIEFLQSSSSLGVSTITARLRLNYDANRALAEISSKVDQVRGDLPPEAEVPIINAESADSQFASAYLSFDSAELAQNEITDFLTRVVQPRLAAIEGVQRADILGGRTFAMRVWLKPEAMAALGVSPGDVTAALQANNYLAPVGRTKGATIQVDLTADTDLRSVEEFRQLVIRQEDGATIRLADVADVALGAETYEEEVRFSGQTAVFIGVWPLPNANALDVIARVREALPELQARLPSGLTARLAYDATGYIRNAISEVVKTLAETVVIVIIVIFLFLGSLRSVLVPLVAIPISLIGAVFLMQVLGFSLNLLTLLAIVLAVGLVVDDAIVVVENVERRLREGLKPVEAALAGARELVGPVIAMTITLAAVYAPIAFQGGLTGTLFREFALTLAGAVVISGVVALTLSPVMASRLLRQGDEERGLARRIHAGFASLRRAYGRVLDGVLARRPAVYVLWAGLSILTVPLFVLSSKELAPTEDQGIIFGILNAPANATIEQTSHFAAEANRQLTEISEADYTFQITSPTFGFGGLVVRPWGDRERTIFEILPEAQQRLQGIPGIQMFPVLPPALPGGGDFPVEFILASTASESELLAAAQQLVGKAAASGKFAFPPLIDLKLDQPRTQIQIDREKVAALGLDLRTVGGDVATMLGGDFVNRFSIDGRSYKVIPQITRLGRLTPEQLEDIHVTGPNGELIPLATVATLEDSAGARSLLRFQQLNAVKISGLPIVPLDEALRFLETEAAAVVPRGTVIDYAGESRQLRTEGDRFLPAMGLAVILIFLVLAAQFNSFRDPLIILLGSVPLAMFGALIFTFLKFPGPPEATFWTDGWTTTMNIYSQVGLVTLVGLVSKNGILIVEFANHLRDQGRRKLEAAREAALTRLRPVLMTSVATVVGHFPLTLVTGAGAEARNSIGLVLVGGMAIGTLFTLFVVPALYVLFAREAAPAPAEPAQVEQPEPAAAG